MAFFCIITSCLTVTGMRGIRFQESWAQCPIDLWNLGILCNTSSGALFRKWFLKWKYKKKLQMGLFKKLVCILSSCPSYFDKNAPKISKFLAFIEASGNSTFDVIFLFLHPNQLTMAFLIILLMLHDFFFFLLILEIMKTGFENYWTVTSVMWLGNLGSCLCVSV